ncbi:MAG: hypothetical protein KatS3mg060_1032 [Dehalococcoidia bacterium]|nr:MAG: hypothetical protein KatS3mg060_1032 [Dehalococcoidia bacterium]
MDIVQAIVLGVVQGLTEFLPISSSGHLVIAHSLFGWQTENDLAFDVALHLGTLLAVPDLFRPRYLRHRRRGAERAPAADVWRPRRRGLAC